MKKYENVGLGTAGALIGALVGAAVYVLLYFAGYVAGLSGFVAVALGYFLYRKLAGVKSSVKGVVIAAVATVIAIVLAEFVAVTIDVQNLFKTERGITIDLSKAFEIVMEAFNDDKFVGEFLKELGMGLLFAVIGGAAFVSGAVKTAKEEQAMLRHNAEAAAAEASKAHNEDIQ